MTEITKSPKHDENSSLSLISDLKKFFCEKLQEMESNINNNFNTINAKLEAMTITLTNTEDRSKNNKHDIEKANEKINK